MRYLKIVLITFFLSGCSSGYSQNIFRNINNDVKSVSVGLDTFNKNRNYFTLLVKTKPIARVKILNSNRKYKDNILLKKGKYLIEVTKKGYQKYKIWVDLNKNKILNIELKPIKDKHISSNTNYFNGNISGVFHWKSIKLPRKYTVYSRKLVLNSIKLGYGRRYIWTDFKTKKGLAYKDAKKLCTSLKPFYWRLPSCYETKDYFSAKRYFIFYAYEISINKKGRSSYGGDCGNDDDFEVRCIADPSNFKFHYNFQQVASDIYNDLLKDKKSSKKDKNYLKSLALSYAAYIKFGKPSIEDLKYDAKNETYDVSIASSKLKDIYVESENKLKNAALDHGRYASKVFVTKNYVILKYNAFYGGTSKGIDLRYLEGFRYIKINGKLFSRNIDIANVHIRQHDNIVIFYPRKKTDSKVGILKIGRAFLRENGFSGHNSFGKEDIAYNPQIISQTKVIKKYFYKNHIKIEIPKRYASLFQEVMLNDKIYSPEILLNNNKEGKIIAEGFSNIKDAKDFLDHLIATGRIFDRKTIKNYLQDFPNSKYANRLRDAINIKFYKGYTPKMPFKIQGCTGYYPMHLIMKNMNKIIKTDQNIMPDFWDKISWDGLCRRGLLSGRGTLKFERDGGLFYVRIDGKMKNGFFIGKVKRDIEKNMKGHFWNNDEIEESIKLNKYEDFVNYQKGL